MVESRRELLFLDDTFPCRSAVLECFVSPSVNSLFWGFNVNFGAGRKRFDRTSPEIKCEALFATTRGQVTSDWRNALPHYRSWDEAQDANGDPIATFYFEEHCPIEMGRMLLKHLRHNQVLLELQGTVTVPVESEVFSSVPLRLTTALDFVGVWCGRKSENDARSLIAPYVDPSQFVFEEADGGISLMRPRA